MTTQQLNPKVAADLRAAIAISDLPNVHWILGDDLCDCTFQRIYDVTNPYLAQTQRVRLCCIWEAIYKQFPEHVQDIPAFYDSNRNAWVREPMEWNSEESDMPVYLWFRQMAAKTGKSLPEIRAEYGSRLDERPKRVAKGTGWESQKLPSEAELSRARREIGIASGWLLPES